ncbi:MAG: hypothetical protein AB1632_13820 [Nitrospirota bacterium]
MEKKRKKLGELLLEAGLIDEMQLKSALSYQGEWGGRLGTIVIMKGFVTEQDLVSVIERQLGLSCISLDNIEKPSDEVLKMVNVDIAKKFGIFPIKLEGKSLMIATADPTDLKMLDDIGFMLGVRIKPRLALESDIQRAIETHYEGGLGEGKMFRINKEKLKEKILGEMPIEPRTDTIKTNTAAMNPAQKDTAPKKEISQKIVIESIVDLLVEKGVFTKEELISRIKSKK